MKAETLLQILCAAHLTGKVEDPYDRRGGIMLISPAGHGKSTLLKKLSKELPRILCVSDLTTRQLSALRASIVEGRVETLIIDELEKIYQRKLEVAGNLEGHLMSLIEQGFTDLPEKRPSSRALPAQVLIITACTEEFYLRKQNDWSSAFLRRFLPVVFRLDDPRIFGNAVRSWNVVKIGAGMFYDVPLEKIPNLITEIESDVLRGWLDLGGIDDKTPFQLLKKIGTILRWRFKKLEMEDLTMKILEEFSEGLRMEGARLTFSGGE